MTTKIVNLKEMTKKQRALHWLKDMKGQDALRAELEAVDDDDKQSIARLHARVYALVYPK